MHHAKALRIVGKGGPEVLEIGALEVREPGHGEVLVQIAAAGLNRADVLQRRGFYPAPPGFSPDIPGLEYSGTIAKLGPAVTRFAEGDRVMAITAGGGMATHLVAHERELMAAPSQLSLHQAAAIPEVFLTVYDALIRQGGMGPGCRVLVHAIGSGIGTAAAQLANVVGARVVGTSRSASKLERIRARGLAATVLVEEGRFADATREALGGAPDLILDTVGAAYLEENIALAAPGARIVVIGLLGGIKGTLPLGALLAKRLTLRGSVLRSRPLEEKAALAQEASHALLPLFEAGRLEPWIDSILPMREAAEAHRRMEANETLGKIVLRWGEPS